MSEKENLMLSQITCPECSSGIEIYLKKENTNVICGVCDHDVSLHISNDHEASILKSCAVCEGAIFYQQRDFNRRIGVVLFIIAAILSIWTYGLSFVALWLVDLFLFKKLSSVAICYKCETIYRGVENLSEIEDFDHLTHDKIVYAD